MQGGLSVECWRRSRGVLKLGESEAVVLGLHDKALFENWRTDVEGNNRRRCVWGGGQKRKRKYGIQVKWLSGNGDRLVWAGTKIWTKIFGRETMTFSDEKQKFEDRLNMIFVNLEIDAALVNIRRGPFGEAVQPEAATRSAWSPVKLIHMTDHVARDWISNLFSVLPRFRTEVLKWTWISVISAEKNFDTRSASKRGFVVFDRLKDVFIRPKVRATLHV
jgi:hypothetical protein